jgi:LuxR family maltose regulon positive regulatory protein
MLDRLEEANLFVVPLDGERRWYRYHHLFADLLRGRLTQTQPNQVPDLHRRASEWYEQHRLIAEAVGHGLAAGDVDRVVRLVERNAITMMDRGELTIATLVSWLDALPDEVVRARPWLCVAHAWALAYAGRLDTIELLLQDAERALEKPVPPFPSEAEAQRVAGYISTIQSYMAGQKGDMSLAIELAREALERLPEEELLARAFTMGNLSSMLRMSGDFEAATQALVEAIAIGQAAGDSYTTVITICALAARQIIQGQLHRAFATCQDALRLADEHVRQGQRRLPVAGYAHTQLSRVLREWNDLEAAVRHARQGLELCQQWGPTDNLVVCYFDLAKALQAIGDPDGALGAIQEARQVALDLKSSLIDEAEAEEADLRLAQGDMAAASRWAASVESELDVDDRVSFRSTRQRARCFTLVRILIAQGATSRALELLARLLPVVEAGGEMGHAIEILILQAIALQARGEIDRALASLERALALAEPEGYVRIFIDEGPPMGELLRQAATQGIAPEYVSRLLAALEVSEYESMRVLPPHPQPLIEPLSNRELEVLQLLAAGLSNREIAKTLVIALGTVKNHLQNIYGKLDVHNRTQAVHRARELGLL